MKRHLLVMSAGALAGLAVSVAAGAEDTPQQRVVRPIATVEVIEDARHIEDIILRLKKRQEPGRPSTRSATTPDRTQVPPRRAADRDAPPAAGSGVQPDLRSDLRKRTRVGEGAHLGPRQPERPPLPSVISQRAAGVSRVDCASGLPSIHKHRTVRDSREHGATRRNHE